MHWAHAQTGTPLHAGHSLPGPHRSREPRQIVGASTQGMRQACFRHAEKLVQVLSSWNNIPGSSFGDAFSMNHPRSLPVTHTKGLRFIYPPPRTSRSMAMKLAALLIVVGVAALQAQAQSEFSASMASQLSGAQSLDINCVKEGVCVRRLIRHRHSGLYRQCTNRLGSDQDSRPQRLLHDLKRYYGRKRVYKGWRNCDAWSLVKAGPVPCGTLLMAATVRNV